MTAGTPLGNWKRYSVLVAVALSVALVWYQGLTRRHGFHYLAMASKPELAAAVAPFERVLGGDLRYFDRNIRRGFQSQLFTVGEKSIEPMVLATADKNGWALVSVEAGGEYRRYKFCRGGVALIAEIASGARKAQYGVYTVADPADSQFCSKEGTERVYDGNEG